MGLYWYPKQYYIYICIFINIYFYMTGKIRCAERYALISHKNNNWILKLLVLTINLKKIVQWKPIYLSSQFITVNIIFFLLVWSNHFKCDQYGPLQTNS